MCSRKYTFPLAFFLGVAAMCGHVAGAEQDAVEDAWKTLPTYEYGQDMATLLKIDGAVIDAMATPESRESCAARLARVLTSDQTTLAARHYICLKLREIGTRNEVPVLAKMLAEPDTSEMARQALQVIPAPEAGKALRESLATLEGELLVGAINSVAARKDVDAVSELKRLSASEDQHVAEAALWALGNIPDQDAASFLLACFSSASLPTPRKLAVPLLRSAAYLKDTGNIASAKSIYTQLSREAQCTGVRRAALEGLLQLESEQLSSTVLSWLADSDSDTMRQTVALGHLHALSPEQLDQLLKRLEKLSPSTQMAVIELAAPQRGQTVWIGPWSLAPAWPGPAGGRLSSSAVANTASARLANSGNCSTYSPGNGS